MAPDEKLRDRQENPEDVGESSYRHGLQTKPDILIRELKKVDLSWLP